MTAWLCTAGARAWSISTFGLLLFLPTLASAQTETAFPSSRLTWEMQATTEAIAEMHTYHLSVDGGASTLLAGVECDAGSPVTCRAPLPALTVGRHTLVLRARLGGVESDPSPPLEIAMVVVVTPTGLRIE